MRKTFFIVLIITGAVTLVSGYTLLTTRKTPPVATFAKTDKKAARDKVIMRRGARTTSNLVNHQ